MLTACASVAPGTTSTSACCNLLIICSRLCVFQLILCPPLRPYFSNTEIKPGPGFGRKVGRPHAENT